MHMHLQVLSILFCLVSQQVCALPTMGFGGDLSQLRSIRCVYLYIISVEYTMTAFAADHDQ